MTPHPSILKRQSGNVLFYILLCIALFAALGYAFSRGGTGGAQAISDEKASLLADELIAQSSAIRDSVSKLRLKGIGDTNISFENSSVTGYTNAGCTQDDCKVFAPNGGGMTWASPPPGANNGTSWCYYGGAKITYVGTNNNLTGAELLMVLPEVNEKVCEKINMKANISSSGTPIPMHTLAPVFQKFTGSISYGSHRLGGGSGSDVAINGQSFFCMKSSSSTGTCLPGTLTNKNFFIRVLIAR
ncbi:MAG: hypothetical protein DI586_03670 [Micavibrio aeruginosavorus]|uniref:Uncharacterized protein n=1 Tax=Micavibrio aeruginosavorus TaxID=349221 RepID=A0A2W5FKG2_9BACT|nr:MAG: hypothetical protein DI586_03670 [Micavibrio aeruginosavorus]